MTDIKVWLDPTKIDDWSEDKIQKLVFGSNFTGKFTAESGSVFVLCTVEDDECDRFLEWLDNNPSVEAFMEV